MDGVEASRIVEETLKSISTQFGIDLHLLRVTHRPILAALQGEQIDKLATAEAKGFDRGRIASEMRHWGISGLEFGRITKGDDAMDKAGIYCILESTIRLGGKAPGTVSNKKLRAIQAELELCNSVSEVVAILDTPRSLICQSFGIDDLNFDECLGDIKSLDFAENDRGEMSEVDRQARAMARVNNSVLLIYENGQRK
jgi:hypothetical protein